MQMEIARMIEQKVNQRNQGGNNGQPT